MPAIVTPNASTPGPSVLVSGANGFMAIWVCQKLLEKGYTVRGAIRSAKKGPHLSETFKAYGDRFEIVVVEDITADGAFDDAVKGMDAIVHTASPADPTLVTPEAFIDPAVKGTLGILRSAAMNGTTIKRVVITASTAAVYTLSRSADNVVFSEDSWNEEAILHVQQKGVDAPIGSMYQASKTLAEKAAWKFVEENKPSWDLTILNPSWIFGPVLHEVPRPSALNASSQLWYHSVIKGFNAEIGNNGQAWASYIDVRDLGDAHVAALEKEAASGERIIMSNQPTFIQDWWKAVAKVSSKLSVGVLGSAETGEAFRYNTAKADRILGLRYLTLEETARDTVLDYEKRGW